jgi:AcrR family transcriptional regulator
VIAAATKVVKAGGYEEMTIRSLAAELKVAPMSLYRHVRDKDDLLDEVVDRLLSRAWQPRANERDWQAWVAEAADKLRRFLVAQPAALHVYLRHPVVSPAAIARMNAMMDVLR